MLRSLAFWSVVIVIAYVVITILYGFAFPEPSIGEMP